MGLFRKNPNETAYTGGKKHWTDVIKNSGAGNLLIWRQPEEDFNTNSTLIVMPGEQAIFINGGIVEQVFENGTYRLSTENYPFISRLRNAFSGGISVFNCVVYFVRTAHSEEILWGTDTPIQVRDKVHGIRTEIRARGSYKVQIKNPVIFLEKCVGNNIPYQRQTDLNKYFAMEFQSKIKSSISKAMNAYDQELIGLDEHMDDLSELIEPFMNESLQNYGLGCIKFTVAGLDVDTTKYDSIDAYTIAGTGKVINARADKQVFGTLGEDWGRQQAANILTNISNNPGAGGVASTGAGMGMGMAAGNVFAGMAQQLFQPMQPQQQAPPPTAAPSGRFMQQNAPQQSAAAPDDPVAKIKKLKEMLDIGAITQEEYDAKKAEILNRL